MMIKLSRGLLALAASAALILWIGQSTDIDLRLADMVFDRARGVFPLQHAWFAEQFNHVILKALLSCLAGAAVVLALWDAGARHVGHQRAGGGKPPEAGQYVALPLGPGTLWWACPVHPPA